MEGKRKGPSKRSPRGRGMSFTSMEKKSISTATMTNQSRKRENLEPPHQSPNLRRRRTSYTSMARPVVWMTTSLYLHPDLPLQFHLRLLHGSLVPVLYHLIPSLSRSVEDSRLYRPFIVHIPIFRERLRQRRSSGQRHLCLRSTRPIRISS